MDNIESLWVRLESWARNNAPEITAELNNGADSEDIEALEAVLGVTLPPNFKASLAIHDGEDDGWPCRVFAEHGAYLSTTRIVEEWRDRQRHAEEFASDPGEDALDDVVAVDGPVQPKLFMPGWVPFMECNGDVFWAIDFSPAPGGTHGQIIEVDWEACSWSVIADSFTAFFDDYVTDLEQGEYDEAIATSGHNPDANMDKETVGLFRLVFGAVVVIAGFSIFSGSGAPQKGLGLLLLAWGGLILRRWWRERGSAAAPSDPG